MRAAFRRIAIVAAGSAQLVFVTFGCSDSTTGGDCGPGGDGPRDAPNADAPNDAGGDGMKAEAATDASADTGAGPGDATRDAGDAATDTATDASTEAGDAATDAGGALTDVDATTANLSAVRMANWSPDSPAIDFCLALHGTGAFRGPVVNRLANAGGGDAGVAALAFPQMSAYSYVVPGKYDARLVVAGAADCTAGIGADATTLPTLSPGTFATIVLVGEAHAVGSDPGLQLVGFLDDQRAGGMVSLRFINAAPAIPKVDMGTGAVATFKPLFLGVPFGQTSTADGGATNVDSNGYLTMQPLSAVTLSAHPPGATQDSAIALNVSAGAGSILTIALLAGTAGTSAEAGVQGQLIECIDNAGTAAAYANCLIISK